MLTEEQAYEILGYVANELISPMAFDERPAKEYWLEASSEKFNKLCEIVYNNVEKPLDKSSKV